MKGPIAWFARNHVAANIFMAVIVAGGLLALPTIRQEVFPSLVLPVLAVSVDYPGASPEEVEESICVRIEEALSDLQGLRRLSATASEGQGTVIVELTFARGGIGSLLAGSVLSRDYPMILFLVMFSALVYVFINSLIELLQDALDPRISFLKPPRHDRSTEVRS